MKTYKVDNDAEFTTKKKAINHAKKTCPVFARISVYIDGVFSKLESFQVWFS